MMTRQELHALAAAGARAQVQVIEERLAMLHKEWPELFVSKTPPVLLAAALKTSSNGNGHWPSLLRDDDTTAASGLTARQRAKDRDQQVLAFIAQQPTGVTPMQVSTALHLNHQATDRAMRRLAHRHQLRRVAKSRGVYVVSNVTTGGTQLPIKMRRRQVVWTDAMRAAAAKRMRARHRDPAFREALVKSRRRKKKARL